MLEAAAIDRLEDATPLLSDPPALRARALEDGALYFRGLLPAAEVRRVRRGFVQAAADQGWLRPGTDPDLLLSDHAALTENDEAFAPAFERFQRMPEFHALAHHPRLVGTFRALFDAEVLVHPRNIGRMMFPGTPFTPPHQDYLHIRGTENTWTAWIPQGDVPTDLGGLAVWRGSHRSGLLPVRAMPGAGGSGIEDDNLHGAPATADFQVGDVLMLHSMTIHASLPNRTGDRMRLSLDYRYQPRHEPVDLTSLLPHLRRFDWEHVYRDWPAAYDHLRYYWKDMPLVVQDHHNLGGKGSAAKGKGGY